MRLTVLLFVLSITKAFSQEDIIADVKKSQEEINSEYKDPKSSPLETKELRKFKSLPFFDIDPAYRVVAKLRRTDDSQFTEMKTTTPRMAKHRVYGILEFTLLDKKIEIPVYQSESLMSNPEYKDYLFFPFTDLTNSEETYGGGRYIDLRIPAGDEITIDFNKAYNPYCAYSAKYSCPIVPSENHIDLEVKAGVRFEGGH